MAFLLLGGYTIFAGVVFFDKPRQEICKELDIEIANANEIQFIDQAQVKQIMGQANLMPVGLPMGIINTEAIEQCLKSNQLINKVECYKTNDHRIRLEVEQRVPILRVMSYYGNFYIDKEGKVMPVSQNYAARLPIASGFIEKEFAERDLYKFALFLRDNAFWTAQIQQIDVAQNHDITIIPTVGDQRITLGQLGDFETKLNNLFAFYQEGCSQFGWSKYKTINLRYDGQVICTPI